MASFFLAGAADKSGTITVDLIQYINTILDIPNALNNALSDIQISLTSVISFINEAISLKEQFQLFSLAENVRLLAGNRGTPFLTG